MTLVTGAAGFIGKNIIKRLQNLGYEDILGYTRANTEAELRGVLREG